MPADLNPYGTPGGTPQLGALGTVLQNPASASVALGQSGIPISDVSGSIAAWSLMCATPNVIDDSLATPPGAPRESDAYILAASPTGAWSSFNQGDLVVWNGSAWIQLILGVGGLPASGTRVLVTAFQGTAAGTFAGHSQQIGLFMNGAWAFTTPQAGWSIVVNNNNDPLEGAAGVFKTSTNAWSIASQVPRSVVTASTATTVSTTDAVVSTMTFTPAAGTYEVYFFGGFGNSNSNASVTASIYAGGSQSTGTEQTGTTNVANWRMPFCCLAPTVVVNGTQAIEGRLRVSANTGSIVHHGIKIRRVA